MFRRRSMSPADFCHKDLPNPPKYNKVNPADTPILTLSITSDSLPLDKVNDFADTLLAQKLSEVTGVGLVTIRGKSKAGRARAGQSGGDLRARSQLGRCSHNSWSGERQRAERKFRWAATSYSLSDRTIRFFRLTLTSQSSSPTKTARRFVWAISRNVIDSVENDQLGAWVGTKAGEQPAVLLDIQRQPGANIIQTVDRVKTTCCRS